MDGQSGLEPTSWKRKHAGYSAAALEWPLMGENRKRGPRQTTTQQLRTAQELQQQSPPFLSSALPRSREILEGLPRRVAAALGAGAPTELVDTMDRVVVTAEPRVRALALRWCRASPKQKTQLILAAVWPSDRVEALDARLSTRLAAIVPMLEPTPHVIVFGGLDRDIERALVIAVAALGSQFGISQAMRIDEAPTHLESHDLWRPIGLLVGRRTLLTGALEDLLEVSGHVVLLDDGEGATETEVRGLTLCPLERVRSGELQLPLRSARSRTMGCWRRGELGWR